MSWLAITEVLRCQCLGCCSILLPIPEITRFYGIVIKVFFGDHPPPHFHAIYGEYNALVNIVCEIVILFTTRKLDVFNCIN